MYVCMHSIDVCVCKQNRAKWASEQIQYSRSLTESQQIEDASALGIPPTRRQGEVVLTQVPATDPIGTFKHSILRWAAKSTIPAIIPTYINGQDPNTSDYHLEMIGRSYLIPTSFSTKVRSHSLWTPTPRRSCSPGTELKLRTGRSSL